MEAIVKKTSHLKMLNGGGMILRIPVPRTSLVSLEKRRAAEDISILARKSCIVISLRNT